MDEIKVGSIVFLNSYPEMKFTVIATNNSIVNIIGYNKEKQEFVTLTGLPKAAFTLSK